MTKTIEFEDDAMGFSCFIRKIRQEEIETALLLVWQVFQQYEAPDYTQEGAAEFYKSIHDETYLSELCWYGAFVQDDLAGVLATRSAGVHRSVKRCQCGIRGADVKNAAKGAFTAIFIRATPNGVSIRV